MTAPRMAQSGRVQIKGGLVEDSQAHENSLDLCVVMMSVLTHLEFLFMSTNCIQFSHFVRLIPV